MQNFLATFKAIHAQAVRVVKNQTVGDFACEHDKAVLCKFALLWADAVIADMIDDAKKGIDIYSFVLPAGLDLSDDALRATTQQTQPQDDYEFYLLFDALKTVVKALTYLSEQQYFGCSVSPTDLKKIADGKLVVQGISKQQALDSATNKKLKAAIEADDFEKANQIARKVDGSKVIYDYLSGTKFLVSNL